MVGPVTNRVILVTGGARSGKSRYAQEQAEALSQGRPGEKVLFIATAEASDDEMRVRIERHKRDRPSTWHTREAPREAAKHIAADGSDYAVILLDCLTLFVSNILLAYQDQTNADIEAHVDREVKALCEAARAVTATVIMVTNEVGMGLHPLTPLGRLFQDLAGRANQQIASEADELILMVCGIPWTLKPAGHR